MSALSPQRVRITLTKLRRVRPPILGADHQAFEANPVVARTELAVFEDLNSIRLPSECRDFLTLVGNGGARPFYGIFPLCARPKKVGAPLGATFEHDLVDFCEI